MGRRGMLTVVLGVMVALAACGSSSSGKASTSPKSTATSAPATSSAAVVATAKNTQHGTILVDSSGRTLYTLTSNGAAVACSGACASAWPPLLLPAGQTTATGASGVTGLGTTAANGGQQVTQKGLPLYRFSGDSTAGDANGDGITSFGGTWHVVKSGAAGATGGTTASTTSTTSGSGSGY